MKRLIFLGAPGAGKGTQATVVAQDRQIAHISTGDILRAAVAAKTELGQQADTYMSRGDLVPDELVLGLVKQRLQEADAQAGWILDGFPRNAAQAEALDSLLADIGQSPDHAINLDVPDEILVARLLDRGQAQGRKDDTEEVIRHRLRVYREQTAPLIDFYELVGKLVSVNGDAPVEAVTHHLISLIS
ncbi:MAG: adenylate kinase [Synechococcales cyanobacterium CRU_2_2]|nr:adenylate kinase [Synechococcales cyanobacterium CRU_2_2]